MAFARSARSVRTPEIRFAARSITSWLNTHRSGVFAVKGSWEFHQWKNTASSRKRIIALITLVREQLAIFEAMKADLPQLFVAPDSSETTEQNDNWNRMTVPFPLIEREMTRYATIPVLTYLFTAGRLGIRQRPASKRYPLGEFLAAHGIISLAQAGALDLLRICACGDWYFAGRSDSPACSPACKQKIYDQTPQAKAKRKARAKRNKDFKMRR